MTDIDPIAKYLGLDLSTEGAEAMYNRSVDLFIDMVLQASVCFLLNGTERNTTPDDEEFERSIDHGIGVANLLLFKLCKELTSDRDAVMEHVKARARRSADRAGGLPSLFTDMIDQGIAPKSLNPESLN